MRNLSSPVEIEALEMPARSRAPGRRFFVLYLALAAVCAVLLVRSFYLQIWSGSRFLAQAEGNRMALLPLPAPRGLLFDRAGKQIVENIASTDIVLDPTLLPSSDDEAILLETLPPLLDISPESVQKALQVARSQRRVTVLLKAVPHDQVLKVEEALVGIPGVRLMSSSVRKYLISEAVAHVVGYTSAVTSEELTANEALQPTDQTGKAGIEKVYDEQLRGTHGATYTEIDARGRPLTALGRRDPVAGVDLKLTLNSELQEFAYDLLKEWQVTKPDSPGAAVVVLDVRTGAIQALVNTPSFDLNAFSQPSRRQEANRFLTDARQPLFNRAVDGTYPPGSTIKPFLGAAALAEGIITPESTVLSTGGIDIGPWHFPDWKAGGHGVTNLNKAIAESVNTFFYLATGGDETRRGLGVTKATEYLRAFGWGKPTGIDLAGEAPGFLPSPEWKKRTKNETWYIGDTYHLGIGQGDVLVTPLQIGVSTAAMARGELLQPHLVEHVTAPDGTTTAIDLKRQPVTIDNQHLQAVRQGMRQTIEEGSGRSLHDLPVALAGKTGTAQQGGFEETHAWFTSFGPYDTPTRVVTVLLERGGEGDKDAVPIARKIWQWMIEHNDV
jgi:penicillin-binding protein 2